MTGSFSLLIYLVGREHDVLKGNSRHGECNTCNAITVAISRIHVERPEEATCDIKSISVVRTYEGAPRTWPCFCSRAIFESIMKTEVGITHDSRSVYR